MKLSKLTYHNGAIKIEVYQKGQDRKRWNTGIRVDRNLLTKERFIKPNDFLDWRTLNVRISEEKEKVDRVLRKVYQEQHYVDVLRVFEILEGEEQRVKAAVLLRSEKARVSNGALKKKMGNAIDDLRTNLKGIRPKVIKYRKKWEQVVEDATDNEEVKRERFLKTLEEYLQHEASVTSQTTIARHFASYLTYGTSIGFNNLKRHYRIFDFMINNPVLIEDVSDTWLRKLITWLGFGMDGEPIICNTTDWLFNRFRCFWTWALNNNIINKRIDWKRYKIETIKPGFVWLTWARIMELQAVEFKEHDLECARKAYLIISLTGLRHSDFHSLRPDQVIRENDRWYIHKGNKKTRTVFKAEVHDSLLQWVKSEEILRTIKFSRNSSRSDHLLNENIRELGLAMGWTEPVRMQIDSDKWETKPFFKWMNCHSGRHSAVSLWLSKGATSTKIKKSTGWKGSKMIDYYADIVNLETQESINDMVKF